MLNHPDERLLRRVRDEYVEMPGLRLTSAQAQRLWAIDADTCAAVFDLLVTRRFLTRGLDGQYLRLSNDRLRRELQRASWRPPDASGGSPATRPAQPPQERPGTAQKDREEADSPAVYPRLASPRSLKAELPP